MTNPTIKFDELVLQLEILRQLLNKSAIEAYCGLREHSPFGPCCQYVRSAGKTFVSEGQLPEILAQCMAMGAYVDSSEEIQQDFLKEKPDDSED